MALIVRTKAQVDAKPGPMLAAAPHFSAREMACHHCGALRVRTELLIALEALRTRLGHPLPIVDAYRCPVHNKAVGGATHSQHLNGAAADIPGQMDHARLIGLHLFSGVGWVASSGLVVHVDVRHVFGGGATTAHPATWTY